MGRDWGILEEMVRDGSRGRRETAFKEQPVGYIQEGIGEGLQAYKRAAVPAAGEGRVEEKKEKG